MPCHFCGKLNHVSEYCHDYPTLRSRYSYIFELKQNSCLCPKYEPIDHVNTMCKCKIICPVCFQHHHLAMCPKRDPEHPSNPVLMPEPLCLFSHHSPFARRFFELCNPIDQLKLQKTCKFFQRRQPLDLKLKPNFDTLKSSEPNNVVFNRRGEFFCRKTVQTSMLEKNCYFNLDSISLEKCDITTTDLQILSKADPNTVLIKNCTLEYSFSLYDILEAFPYAYDITYISEVMSETWIFNFLCAKKKVNYRKITVRDNVLNFDVNDLVMLFEQNERLILTVLVESLFKTPIRQELQTHPQFSACEPDEDYKADEDYDLRIAPDYGKKYCFRFLRF